MTDLDPGLARELRLLAEQAPLSGGDAEACVRRAVRRRHARRRLQATVLTLVAIAVAGVVALRPGPDPSRRVVTSASPGTLARGATGVTWGHGDTPNALAYVSTQAVGNTLYALSTAPGPADPSAHTPPTKVLYRSTDGVEWTPADPAGGGSFLADLAARGDRLYAVGTGTASVVTAGGKAVADMAVRWTDNGARTWQSAMLNIDLAAVAAKSTSIDVGSISIAAGSQGVVAVAGITAHLDLAKVLPAGVAAPNGWAVTDTGIDILAGGSSCPTGTSSLRPGAPTPPTTVAPVAGGPSGPGQLRSSVCFSSDGSAVSVTPDQAHGVARSFTWAELGIDGDLLLAVEATPMTFWSADGASFQRVDAPLAHLGAVQVTTAGDGFAMVAQRTPAAGTTAAVLRSSDGRHWAAAAAPAVSALPSALGEVGGRVALVGTGVDGPTVAVSDGPSWRTGLLSQVVDPAVMDKASANLMGAAVGPLGVVAVVQIQPDAVARAGGVTVASGGYTLHVLDQRWAGSVTDEAGREVAKAENLRSPGDGSSLHYDPSTQTVVLTAAGGGQQLASFSGFSINQAMRSVAASPPSAAPYEILFSRDGMTWSSQPVADLVGGPIARIGNVMVTDSRIIVTVIPPGGPTPPDHATVLVGTV